MGDTESEDRVGKLAMLGPSINDVMHLRGEGVGQNVTIVLIGCMNGTVTGGGGPKREKFVLHHLWMVHWPDACRDGVR